MEFNVLEILIAVYLAIGIFLVAIGPVAENIAKEVERARGTPLSNAFLEREQPSEKKLFFFKVIVSIGFVIMWPIFIWGVLKQHKEEKEAARAFVEKSKGLWFSYLGGHGLLRCNDCDHKEEVTSFIHGIDSSSSGFQCQECGKFEKIGSGGPGHASEYKRSLTCECGGDLKRDKMLFCPDCKSQNLSYRTLIIT